MGSSSHWNETCGRAPFRVERIEANVLPYYYPFNTFVIVLHSVFVFVTVIWFKYEQPRSLFLQKRSFTAIVVSAIGGITLLICGPIRNTNSAQFSCDFQILLLTTAVPIVLTPVSLRLYSFRNQLEWNRHLAKTSVNKLNHATGYVDSTPNVKSRKSVYHGATKSIRLTPGNPASIGDDQSSTMSGTTMERLTLGLWFRGSIWFSLAIGGTVIMLYFLLLTVPIILVKPYYLNQCTGCLWYPDEQGAVTLSSMIVAAMIIYFSYDIRLEKDPLEIRSEILAFLPVPVFIGTIGTAGMFFDALLNEGRIGDAGVVQFEWFMIAAVVWIHAGQCPLQVWKARKFKHMEGLPSKEEFLVLLSSATFVKLFETHCVAEFSVENLKFFLAVEDYIRKYDSMTTKDRDKAAKAIYNAFIVPGAVMEINIKHHVRKPLEETFDKEDAVNITSDVFESASAEILDLMRKDSLGRWIITKEYKEWATKSVVIKQNGLSVLA